MMPKKSPRSFSQFVYGISGILLFMILNGCSSLGVQPWDRDLLAKDEMSLNAGATRLALDDHIYFSKEGSSGGRGFSGGGCGCN